MALCQLQWVDLQLTSGENKTCSLFFDVQSEENSFLEVFKFSKTKSVSLNDFNQVIGSFQFSVRKAKFQSVDNLLFVFQKCRKNSLKDGMDVFDGIGNELKEIFSFLFLEMKEEELVEFIVTSEVVREAQKPLDNLLLGHMHAKSWTIKPFIAKYPPILLDKFPVMFQGPVFYGFTLKWVHDSDTETIHGT